MAEAAFSQISSVPCHLAGLTKICFAPDGATIFTGGADCLVRIHNANEPDAEPGFHDDHTSEITSLSCSSNHLFTACKDAIARYYAYPDNAFQGYLTRSAGVPVRWVSVDQAGERVAVCSEDLLVKIVHINDTTRVTMLSDNAKSVRSATWDPTGRYLTTASCDGRLKVYDTTDATPLCLRTIESMVAASEPDSNASIYAAWHPSGAYFAVPLRTNDIGIISREGWSKQMAFTDGHKSMPSELAWSPNGKYLASSSQNQILIWSTDSRTIVSRHTSPEGHVSGLAWSPKKNLLVFTTLDGSVHRWSDPVGSDLPSPVSTEAQNAKKLDRLLDDDFGDDDEDMEDKGEDLEGGEDDWIVDDDGQKFAADEDEKQWRKGRTEVVNVTKAQDAFAPGSTAMRSKKRYLAFNMIGVVDVTDQDSHHVVNVEFHDKSARRGYHFQDHTRYFTASLGEQGAAFAAASEGESPSQVYYKPYDSWASSSDWTISLLPGEEAQLVAAGGPPGDGMASVIVATSKGFLRFFSGTGVQRYLWRMGEDVVSMAAGRESVFVVHREGGTSLDGCQNLRYTIFDLETFDIIQEGRIPLPRKVTLLWVGYTTEGVPSIYDSSGLLSVLDRYRRPSQARWVPLLDSSTLARREGKTENYWPVGVTERHFACVILKGSENEPWFPRPLVQEIEMHMPLLGMDNQQGKLEESVVRGEVQLSLSRDLELPESSIKAAEVALDKELLQLVQAACKADALSRALDVVRLMHNGGTIDAAAKVAGFYHLPGLQERIQSTKREVEARRRRQDRERRGRRAEPLPTLPAPVQNGATTSSGKFSDFAPRGGPRRNFGGVNRAETPSSSIATPVARDETYIPETPNGHERETSGILEDSMVGNISDRELSPEAQPKRKRDDFDDFSSKKKDDPGGKNPFAKKSAGGNPFAKAAIAKPLDTIKSTSFFDRVDDIESSGTKAKKATKAKENKPGPKQATLMGMKKAPISKPVHQDSMTSTETDLEETMDEESIEPRGILEESLVQETAGSPDWPDEMDDD